MVYFLILIVIIVFAVFIYYIFRYRKWHSVHKPFVMWLNSKPPNLISPEYVGQLEFGIRQDGVVIWRKKKKSVTIKTNRIEPETMIHKQTEPKIKP